MSVFTIEGVRLDIPDRMLVPPLRAALEEGRYEGQERRALRNHLRAGDRVLELGAGAGLLAVLAARVVGAGAVTTVEANPEMLDSIRANLRENGQKGVRLLHGAAVPDEAAGGAVEFHVHPGFWSASLAPNPRLKARRHAVPALGFHELVRDARANVLVCDIEGGEEFLFDSPLPEGLRLVVIETHPQRYEPETLERLRAALAGAGLVFREESSRGDVWVWERPEG